MRVLIYNPASGDQRDGGRAVDHAEDRGYEVRESEAAGDPLRLAREAAEEGADRVVACGGDGTLNEVVRGVDAAGKLEDVTLGVVPAGTGNGFAQGVRIRSIEHAFEVLDRGAERRLDLGMVGVATDGLSDPIDVSEVRSTASGEDLPRPFLKSCIAGITAEASAETTAESKRRLGTLAYYVTGLRRAREFEGLRLDVHAGSSTNEEPTWSGEVTLLLVGNSRRFPGDKRPQANLEDGRLDVVLVERAPTIDYLANDAADRLLGRESKHITRLSVPELVVDAHEPRQFSLDGELVERDRVRIWVRPRAVRFLVGEEYVPDPGPGPGQT